jgi:DNA-binding NarL/FixJ family response regulator
MLATLVRRRGFLPTMDLITIRIADAHGLLQRQLRSFLAEQRDIQVVGDAMRGRVLSPREALQPHIPLLDVRMPKMDDLKMLRRIRAKSPRPKILLLSEYFEEDFIKAPCRTASTAAY